MKGYKITNKSGRSINGELSYLPNKTYEFIGQLDPNFHGLHFYTELKHIFTFVTNINRDDIEIYEIDAIGDIKTAKHNPIIHATNKLKVIRQIPVDELVNKLTKQGFTFDSNNNLIHYKLDNYDPSNLKKEVEIWVMYDDQNRVMRVKGVPLKKEHYHDFQIEKTEYEGDKVTKTIQIKEDDIHTTNYVYDALGNLIKTESDNHVSYNKYDFYQNQIESVSINKKRNRFDCILYRYDDNHNMIESISHNIKRKFEYDENNNLLYKEVIKLGGDKKYIWFEYDENNNRISEKYSCISKYNPSEYHSDYTIIIS